MPRTKTHHNATTPPGSRAPDILAAEAAARAAGWEHGGDFDGFWFNVREYGSWKAAVSADDTTTYANALECCHLEGIPY